MQMMAQQAIMQRMMLAQAGGGMEVYAVEHAAAGHANGTGGHCCCAVQATLVLSCTA